MLKKQSLLATFDHAFSLLPIQMDTNLSRIQVFATGIQESNFDTRRQTNNGPAAGFFQFEKVGIEGVMLDKRSRQILRDICAKFGIEFDVNNIWSAIQTPRCDSLAVCIARLNYWISPIPIPRARDMAGAWNMYVKTWRPGKPHSERWIESYWRAYGAILG